MVNGLKAKMSEWLAGKLVEPDDLFSMQYIGGQAGRDGHRQPFLLETTRMLPTWDWPQRGSGAPVPLHLDARG